MKSKKGFTLIELMVVMAIIAVLSVLIIAAIQAARRASVETQNKGNARTIEVALEAYAAKNNGTYCGTGGAACTAAGATVKLSTLATTLNGTTPKYISDTGAFTSGACSDATKTGTGGGIVDLKANTFTIYIADSLCAATTAANIGTLVH